jgi:cyclic-di-GMP-binding protein
VAESSFDIEAGVDRQEVDNAINQAAREVATRFDFKGTDTVIQWAGDEAIHVESASEDRVKAALEVLKDKCVKRKVSLKALDIGEPRDVAAPAAASTSRSCPSSPPTSRSRSSRTSRPPS